MSLLSFVEDTFVDACEAVNYSVDHLESRLTLQNVGRAVWRTAKIYTDSAEATVSFAQEMLGPTCPAFSALTPRPRTDPPSPPASRRDQPEPRSRSAAAGHHASQVAHRAGTEASPHLMPMTPPRIVAPSCPSRCAPDTLNTAHDHTPMTPPCVKTSPNIISPIRACTSALVNTAQERTEGDAPRTPNPRRVRFASGADDASVPRQRASTHASVPRAAAEWNENPHANARSSGIRPNLNAVKEQRDAHALRNANGRRDEARGKQGRDVKTLQSGTRQRHELPVRQLSQSCRVSDDECDSPSVQQWLQNNMAQG
eukprot:GEMP01041946.1.p1 GENE.GEMP01041946.1~~GEMP01041946.1.p1  ORF type:complete len:313 (+),score=91.39 GEMP01041946.1:27-965(+)